MTLSHVISLKLFHLFVYSIGMLLSTPEGSEHIGLEETRPVCGVSHKCSASFPAFSLALHHNNKAPRPVPTSFLTTRSCPTAQ